MKIIALIACMHEKDHGIVERTNVQTDAVVVNQCDEDKVEEYTFTNNKGRECRVIFVNTTERGLSKSRNMAISFAKNADVCLICDDDEVLVDDYEGIIANAFSRDGKSVDLAAFSFNRPGDRGHIADHEIKMGVKEICKTSSVELAFRRKTILNAGIVFDEKMGSGTGNGGGEDTKFMMDCKRKKLNMRYFPQVIGTLMESESQWFNGWDKKLMIDSGWTGRREYGTVLGYIYIMNTLVHHYKDYKGEMNCFQAFYYLNKGFFQKR